jgi:hypothetical protein
MKRLPPPEVIVSVCPACGDVSSAVKPSQKGLIVGMHCPVCHDTMLVLVRYRLKENAR